jgi:hypothetical protein
MTTLKHSPAQHNALDTMTLRDSSAEETIETRRARRMAALKKVAGIWANRPDIPADGLDYQRELRSQWQR